MHYHYFDHPQGKITYLKFGVGKELLVVLHGFSDRANLFEAVAQGLSQKYTAYVIDLPYHGATIWNKDHFTPDDVWSFIQHILRMENKERFSVLGYSMGGRIAQVLLKKMLPQLDHLYLVAPDGIDTKWMFNVTLMPVFIRKWLQRVTNNPERFFLFLKFLQRRRLLSKFLHDFAYQHLKTPERRQRIFYTWISIHYFKNYPRQIKKILRESQLPTDLYYGIRDEVIPAKSGKWLKDGLPNVSLHLLEEGHLLINEKLNKLLFQQLNESSVSEDLANI